MGDEYESEFISASFSAVDDPRRDVEKQIGICADGKNIPFAPLTEVTESDWQKVINTNLTGVFHCMKYELLQMQKQGRGVIVNNASIGGLRMAPGFGAYGPSKAGVIAITQTAALENADKGIRVNVICPGPTEGTGLMQDSIDAGAQDAEFLKNNIIPMKKMGTTEDVVDAVVFLCSDMAGHITGMAMPAYIEAPAYEIADYIRVSEKNWRFTDDK